MDFHLCVLTSLYAAACNFSWNTDVLNIVKEEILVNMNDNSLHLLEPLSLFSESQCFESCED